MVLNVPFMANLFAMRDNRQRVIDHRLLLANRKQFSCDHRIGDQALKLDYKSNELDACTSGPCQSDCGRSSQRHVDPSTNTSHLRAHFHSTSETTSLLIREVFSNPTRFLSAHCHCHFLVVLFTVTAFATANPRGRMRCATQVCGTSLLLTSFQGITLTRLCHAGLADVGLRHPGLKRDSIGSSV